MSTTNEIVKKWDAALVALREAHSAEMAMVKTEAEALRHHIDRMRAAFVVFGPSSEQMAEAVEDAARHIGNGVELAPTTERA